MEDCQIPVSGSYSLIRNGRQDEYLFTRITEALNNERLSEELRHMLLVSLDELRNTRHHIQAGRDQWLSALDAINAPVFLLDRDYRVVSANIEYAKCAGMEIRDIIGKPYWHVFPRMDGPSEGRPGGMHKSLEIIEELTLPTGQVFYDHGYTVYDDEDRAQYSLHILEDITEREQDEQTLRNLNRGLLTLRQVKRALTHSTEENALCNEICRILAEDGGYRFVWIAYAEQDGGKPVRPVAWSDDGEGYLDRILAGSHDNEYGHEPTQSVVRSGLPMLINDIAAHPEYTSWREWASRRGFSSVMVLPLSDGSRCIGALNIYSTEPDAFAAETQSLIMEMAGDLATGIAALRHRSGVSDHQSQMRALIQHNPDAVLILDATGNIQFANPAAGDLLGRPVSELIGTPLGLPMTLGETTEIDILSCRDDGTIEPRIAELRLVKNDFAETPGTLAFLHDVTARNKTEQFTTRMGHILEHLWNEIYTINADTLKFIDASAAAQQRLGYTLDELQRMTPMDIKPAFTREAYETMIEPLREGQTKEIYFEAEQRSKDGTLYPVEVRLQLSREEYPPVFIAIIQDNSERRRHLAELEHKALHDTLTDLPNRRLLQDRLDQSLKRARRETTSCAVLLMTVIGLGEINDLMGYQSGDRVLIVVSSRLQDICCESDTLARLGNNEFVIILPDATPESLKLVAWKIQKTFESPIVIDELPLEVEVATGIALYPDHGVDTDTLIKHGYIAMRAAKNDATGVMVYNDEHTPYTLARLKLHGELRRSIENSEMTVFYQPKVEIKSGHIMGVEALARWQHPLDGMISPDDFIPMVERSGLIRPFTRWVIEVAIVQLRNWKADGIELSIAVNLSTRNLLDPELPATIAELLEQYQVSARNLCLEITETALMSRPEQALKVLNSLHEMGAKLSIDDFGTGYSSLAYLKKLPVDELKIDQSFIFGLIDNEDDAVIVRSTIELAHNLGLRVVAEGVESKAAMEKLKIKKCDIAQGYYLSRPLPRAELQQWLHTSPWGLQGTTLRMLDNGKI